MKLNLARDMKNNMKRFYRYIDQKRQAKERVPLLINDKGELATRCMETAEVLKERSALVFTASLASHVSHMPEHLGPRSPCRSLCHCTFVVISFPSY